MANSGVVNLIFLFYKIVMLSVGKKKNFFWIKLILFLTILGGCVQDPNLVVVDIAWYQKKGSNFHIVQRGESLYAVAFRYDLDYRDLAKANSLTKPYSITKGQHLNLDVKKVQAKEITPIKVSQVKAVQKKFINKKKTRKAKVKLSKVSNWVWPTKGKVIQKFSLSHRRKGINIAGKLHQPVLSAANGMVVYSGSSLRGYGNLLIIKHTKNLFSAYAHNAKLLAKENDMVKVGQKIAYLGSDEAKQPMLHFEIRFRGKPVDPLKYLPNIN